MSETIRISMAGEGLAIIPLSDPYGIPHKWDSERVKTAPATQEELLRCLQLIYDHKDSERNKELLLQWFSPYVRGPDGVYGRGPKPSGAEVRSCIRYLEQQAAVESERKEPVSAK